MNINLFISELFVLHAVVLIRRFIFLCADYVHFGVLKRFISVWTVCDEPVRCLWCRLTGNVPSHICTCRKPKWNRRNFRRYFVPKGKSLTLKPPVSSEASFLFLFFFFFFFFFFFRDNKDNYDGLCGPQTKWPTALFHRSDCEYMSRIDVFY